MLTFDSKLASSPSQVLDGLRSAQPQSVGSLWEVTFATWKRLASQLEFTQGLPTSQKLTQVCQNLASGKQKHGKHKKGSEPNTDPRKIVGLSCTWLTGNVPLNDPSCGHWRRQCRPWTHFASFCVRKGSQICQGEGGGIRVPQIVSLTKTQKVQNKEIQGTLASKDVTWNGPSEIWPKCLHLPRPKAKPEEQAQGATRPDQCSWQFPWGV